MTQRRSQERDETKARSGRDRGAIRNLDDIQERELDERGPSRASALIMASFGGACIVFAALALMRSPAKEAPEVSDPLGALVAASHGETEEAELDTLDVDDVSFPAVLSDQGRATTAMEVVRGGGDLEEGTAELPRAGEMPFPGVPYAGPPPATDRLPVVPLPAQDMLGTAPRPQVAPTDTLRTVAREVAREDESAQLAEAGTGGGYQLQVSSFKKREDAEGFAAVLRRRGHRAHVEEAHVKGRGLWHRVRIGPFKYRRSADIYRQDFEAKERMVTFVVNPPKTRIRIAPAGDKPSPDVEG